MHDGKIAVNKSALAASITTNSFRNPAFTRRVIPATLPRPRIQRGVRKHLSV